METTIMMQGDYKSKLVNSLAQNLSNTVVFMFKAQGHHWNVKGMKFSQFHDFFGMLYSDAHGAIDPMAENILRLGTPAPFKLVDFARYSTLEDRSCEDVEAMLNDLYVANEEIIRTLTEGFEIAEDIREYGISDFLAGRLDSHTKWRWQLEAYLTED